MWVFKQVNLVFKCVILAYEIIVMRLQTLILVIESIYHLNRIRKFEIRKGRPLSETFYPLFADFGRAVFNDEFVKQIK